MILLHLSQCLPRLQDCRTGRNGRPVGEGFIGGFASVRSLGHGWQPGEQVPAASIEPSLADGSQLRISWGDRYGLKFACYAYRAF